MKRSHKRASPVWSVNENGLWFDIATVHLTRGIQLGNIDAMRVVWYFEGRHNVVSTPWVLLLVAANTGNSSYKV